MKHGLVIGRFQLVGNHHADLFEQVVKFHSQHHYFEKLNVGIGVADRLDFRNPFTGTECWQMIKPIAESAAYRMNLPLDYRLIDDINDPPNYAGHVERIFSFSKNDQLTLFSSQYTADCFQNHRSVLIEERIKQHATELRSLYVEGTDISDLVPSHIPTFLEDRKARLEKLRYDNPIPTVDLVIKYKDKIVIIEREDTSEHALPGGHIDRGESAEAAAVREAKEETGLTVSLKGLIGVFSDPDRDPRGHRISVAYCAEGAGKLKPGSDAKSVLLFSLEDVPPLAFDHDEILKNYLEKFERQN